MPRPASSGPDAVPALRRDIGFAGSAFLSFNGVVGAGIFALPATLYAQFALFSPWLFPLFGLLVLVVAVPFARVAGCFPVSGGPVVYAAAFGPLVSFQAGWLYYVARMTALAANANVFVTYLAAFWPPVGDGIGRAAAIVVLIGTLTSVNILGVRRAIRLLDALTLLKALPLVVMAVWGLSSAAEPLRMPSSLPALGEVELAALLVLYAFIGFENSVVPAGETADPKRTIPRALVLTVCATAALYFLVQLAYVAVMAPAAGENAPMIEFGRTVAGPAGALLLTMAALFSLAGNLSAAMTSTPRATFALAERGLLPRWFGAVSARFHTPANSVLFMGLATAALAISSSFVWLAVVSTLARLIVYSLSIAGLPTARAGQGEKLRESDVALMVGAFAICLWAGLQSEWPAWRMLIVLLAVGAVLYLLARRAAR